MIESKLKLLSGKKNVEGMSDIVIENTCDLCHCAALSLLSRKTIIKMRIIQFFLDSCGAESILVEYFCTIKMCPQNLLILKYWYDKDCVGVVISLGLFFFYIYVITI